MHRGSVCWDEGSAGCRKPGGRGRQEDQGWDSRANKGSKGKGGVASKTRGVGSGGGVASAHHTQGFFKPPAAASCLLQVRDTRRVCTGAQARPAFTATGSGCQQSLSVSVAPQCVKRSSRRLAAAALLLCLGRRLRDLDGGAAAGGLQGRHGWEAGARVEMDEVWVCHSRPLLQVVPHAEPIDESHARLPSISGAAHRGGSVLLRQRLLRHNVIDLRGGKRGANQTCS